MAQLGQYSRVILLHAVYREIFQLKDCFTRPLNDWTPDIQQATRTSNDSALTPGVRAKDLLVSWRNAALDCVDVLHWAANGTIAFQAGVEHPTVLHLHLSRTILLAPFDTFQALADSVVLLTRDDKPAGLGTTHRQAIIGAEREILEWAQRDQCKARLAVLHSGCLFWHIRRYSYRVFYEPMAVFLATLTIWAYSSYASKVAGSPQDPSNGAEIGIDNDPVNQDMESITSRDGDVSRYTPDDVDSEPAPTFIHLDRPNDDEMVQTFVRFGTASTMRANITGVGDIYSDQGPVKILKEGRKILSRISTAWGRSDRLYSLLEVLEQVASGAKNLEHNRMPY